MHPFDALFANRKTALRGVATCVLAAGVLLAIPAIARAQAMTPAGVVIDNVADLSFTDGERQTALTSNKVSVRVQEILDVEVEVLTPEVEVEADTRDQLLAFRIRNRGNGWQTFDLSLDLLQGDFDPSACRIIVDGNGDGVLDPSDRASLVTSLLGPSQSVVVWVSCGIPAGASQGAQGRIILRAYPSVFRNGTGGGAGGVFLVMGKTLRTGGGGGGGGTPGVTSTVATFKVGLVNAQLVKSQTVRDPLGGSRAVPGAVITYSLEARFGAGAGGRQVRVTDAVPVGSTYVPGSMTLDGVTLTDAEDGDVGRFTSGGVDVGLGDVAARTARVVTFKVRINPLGASS